MMKCNVCGCPMEDRGYKHAQCRFCGQISNLCCDPEMECTIVAEETAGNLSPASPRTAGQEPAPQ